MASQGRRRGGLSFDRWQTGGGRSGPPTLTAAQPPWRQRRIGCDATCDRGSADRSCSASSSSPRTKAPSPPTPSARCPPQSGGAPDRVFADANRRALTPKEAGRLLARFPLLVGPRALPARHRAPLRGVRRPARTSTPPRPRDPGPAGGRHPLPGRSLRQRLQTPPQERRWHPLGPERSCRATAFAASIRTQPTGPEPTWHICSFVDPTISGTASRRGWRTKASRPG
jgi:hypothetical protein